MSRDPGSATSQAAFFAARELCFRYAGASARAIDGVSLDVPAGSFHAVIGPNGSGKSTLGRLLLGALRPDSGETLMRGRPLREWPRRELALEVGVVPQQEQHAFPLTVAEVVEMGRYPHLGAWRAESAADRRVVEEAMARCDVVELAGRTTSTLSGGERQRVLIARALAQEPRALLLDEPTASLDVRHEMAIFELLRSLARDGVTVLLVTHNLNLAARYADRLTLLHRGRRVASGGAADVLRAERLRDVYGWPVAIRPHPGPGPDTGVPQVVPLAAVPE